MKLVSIFFTASAEYIRVYLKYTKKEKRRKVNLYKFSYLPHHNLHKKLENLEAV